MGQGIVFTAIIDRVSFYMGVGRLFRNFMLVFIENNLSAPERYQFVNLNQVEPLRLFIQHHLTPTPASKMSRKIKEQRKNTTVFPSLFFGKLFVKGILL